MLFCMCVGMAWGQILTTSPTAGKSYTLKCKAADHVGFIGDNGTIVHGRSEAPTSFVFEAAEGVENGFYIKSEVSGQYLYATGDNGKDVVLNSENKTIWVVNAPSHSAGYVSLSVYGKTDLYLNNNGGTNSLKLNSHSGGPGSGNACSLWKLVQPGLEVGEGKYYRIINKANAGKTIKEQRSYVLTTADKDVNDSQQIWYVQGDNNSGYTLKSIYTNRYFNYVDAYYTHWGTSATPVNFYIGKAEAAAGEAPDYFFMTYNASANPDALACAHYSNGNIVRWQWAEGNGTLVNASLWAFEEVSAEAVNTILDGEFSSIQYQVSKMIDESAEILTTADFSNNPFALTEENTTCPAEHNALGGSDGGGVAALLDDDNNTFMHTTYSGNYSEPHYIQVDLGEGKTSKYITFSYRARHNNQVNNPETMIIKGSTDGITYEDITTLTNLPDGLIEYESNVIGNGKAYRYFRFVVTETTNNAKHSGYVFFSMAKFRLNTIEVNDTYASKVNVLSELKKFIDENEMADERPADWCTDAAMLLYDELNELKYGVTLREYPFTLTTDVNNPVCYQILSGRGNATTNYYFTLKPNDGGKVKLETTTQNNIYSYWFFMEEPSTGKLMIVPFMEENSPLGYVTVQDGADKLTNVHTTGNFAGYYYEVIEYPGVEGFPYAIKPYKATTNVSNHGGTGYFMGFYGGGSDGGTAVKFEQVTTPALAYRQLPAAIANANANCPGDDRTGDMLNGYTATSVDAYKAQVAEAEGLYGKVSETTDDVISAQKNTLANLYHDVLEINLPKDGKFYRVRCTDGHRRLLSTEANKNAEGQAVDMRLTLADEVTDESIYCYSGGQLISYTKGLSINAYRFNEVGGVSTVEFSKANQPVLGTYNIKVGDRIIFGAGGTIDSGTGTPDARAGYRWWVEEVTTIPVTITAAQYATFYAPCNVTLPEGLIAYYVSETNSTHASLEEVGNVIPANTGVLLYANVTESTPFTLTIGGDASEVNSKMEGSAASTYVTDDSYVLSMVDSEVGFYTATKNQQDGASWLNNGFKAYLPKTVGSNVQALRFNFGGETTAIETVETENANAPIYDLSGRRVLSTVKGGVYIQNGKKFIVK